MAKEFKHFLKVEKDRMLANGINIEFVRNLNLINDDVLMNLSDEDLEKVSNILDKI
tara:strand:+ start:2029 stop:2196 length:168 start_codon:yes stop_codon:yes gene_type:complete